MQGIEGNPDDTITDTGQPAGAPLAQLMHVQAQHFDEQDLGQFGQHARPARPGRTGLVQGIAHGRLQPEAGTGIADIDLDHRRQPVQQQAGQARITRQIATHQAGSRAAATIIQLPWPARQHFIQTSTGRRRQTGCAGHAMGVPLGKDDNVTGHQVQGRLLAEFDVTFACSDQVENHHAFGTRLQ
ncbi:hypothetical protein D9M71_74960 [compost metagenome]